MKRMVAWLICMSICLGMCFHMPLHAEEKKTESKIESPSAILMEASTGQVIYQKNADEKLAPASVTKIMTMLLIFDALESGKIKLEDQVSVSEFAASMGGSQVFLEPGETQTVETMLKCISVASANDACVAMAEFISGSEEAFVKSMNERAQGLDMKNTTFKNCNGLDSEGHLTTARDIALMSKELITKYPEVHDYCMVWMENITHKTKKGTTEFGLTNTNKLVRHYQYATGLKTGSTSIAKFCVSATAKKDDIELIAVIMAAPDSKIRFKEATLLLNEGFSKCTKFKDDKPVVLEPIKVKGGVKECVNIEVKEPFTYVDTKGSNLTQIKRQVQLQKDIQAPIKKGQKLGVINYYLDKEKIGEIPVVASEDIDEINLKHALTKTLRTFLL